MSIVNDKEKITPIDICKILRKETNISIILCNKASKECNGDLEKARIILKNECIILGSKYYKNPEKEIIYTGVIFNEESANNFKLMKFGSQSDYLFGCEIINKDIGKLFFNMQNFGNFTNEDLNFIENELKFQCGRAKENILLISSILITKKPEEHFYSFKNAIINNENIYENITVIKYTGKLLEDSDLEKVQQQLNINLHGYMKKNIVNFVKENKKIIKYTHELTDENLINFMNSPLLTDRTKTLKQLLMENNIDINISYIFCI